MTAATVDDAPRRRRRIARRTDRTPWNKKPPAKRQLRDSVEITDISRHYFVLGSNQTQLPDDFDRWVACLAYIRVSTDDQADKYSPGSQRTAIAAYCHTHRLRVIDEFFDADSGDMALTSRPEGMALMSALHDQEASTIAVLCLDRLARNPADAHTTWRLFKRQQIELHFTERGRQEDTPHGELIFGVEAAMAGFERRLIMERTMRGKDRKLDSGQWLGIQKPYGYRRTGYRSDANLEIIPSERDVIVSIFHWYVWGDGAEGAFTLRQIAKRLSEKRVPRPSVAKGGDPDNFHWHPATVRMILSNEIYKGVYVHGKTMMLPKEYDNQPKSDRVAVTPRSRWRFIPLPHCAMVPEALWDAAQRRLQANIEQSSRNRPYHTIYLMSGFVVCCKCGYHAHGDTVRPRRKSGARPEFRYYRFSNKDQSCACCNELLRCQDVDDLLWGILRVQLDESRLNEHLEQLRRRQAEGANFTRDRIEEIEVKMRDLDRRLTRLTSRYGDTDDEIVAAAIKKTMLEISEEIKVTKAELARAKTSLDHAELTEERESQIRQMAAAIRRRLGSAVTLEQKRAIMSSLEFKVRVSWDDPALPRAELNWCLGGHQSFGLSEPLYIPATSNSRRRGCRTR
jgi:DNA invertase Pin-like site-specific DNA recombinase